MVIGIKYCGGCNPRYQRGVAVKKLKENFPEHEYVVSAEKNCDIWIIVCGCSRACADSQELQGSKRTFVAVGERDFGEIYDYLRQARQSEEEAGKERDRRGHQKKILRIGDTAEIKKTFYRDDAEKFAMLTGDRNSIHLDGDFAAKHWFGKPVIHGALVSGLFSAVMGTRLPGEGTILTEEKIRYERPVYYGDTISAKVVLIKAEEGKSRYIGTLEGQCVNQKGEIVAEGVFTQMMIKDIFEIGK